jgi:hypothetical protein
MAERTLTAWMTAVELELGLESGVDSAQGLEPVDELSSRISREVTPEAAARTAFLLGVAAGRAQEPAVAAQDMAQKLGALADGWSADAERGVPSNDQSQRG